MALFLSFSSGSCDLQDAPNTNYVYSGCNAPISGLLSTDDLGGISIDNITINENTITVSNFQINYAPPSYPFVVTFGSPVIVTFEIVSTGTVGNADQIKLVFDFTAGGAESFTYDIDEVDLQASIVGATPIVPFGTVIVGNTGPSNFEINNVTCVRWNYSWYSDNLDMTFGSGGVSLFPRSVYYETPYWTPTSAYDLSTYSIYCDTDCGTAIYGLTGISINTPPPVVGSPSKKLIIANSISI